MEVLAMPQVIMWLNPKLKEHYMKIYSKNLDPEEAIRLENLLHGGYEGYSHVKEEDLVKAIEKYIKKQDNIQKGKWW